MFMQVRKLRTPKFANCVPPSSQIAYRRVRRLRTQRTQIANELQTRRKRLNERAIEVRMRIKSASIEPPIEAQFMCLKSSGIGPAKAVLFNPQFHCF